MWQSIWLKHLAALQQEIRRRPGPNVAGSSCFSASAAEENALFAVAARALGVDDAARSICHGRNDGETSLRQLRLLLQSFCTQGDSGKIPTHFCCIDLVMM
jgi:hypothetical protein